MLAAGVKLRSRDHAFELVDFLQDNPHLKPFISSIIVQPTDFPPYPLLHILSNLSEITFFSTESTLTMGRYLRRVTYYSPHPFHLAGFRLFGSRIHTLRLCDIPFPTCLAFAHLLLAFSSITDLVCEGVVIGTEGNQAPLAVAKQRL